jgi:hypothetical protein
MRKREGRVVLGLGDSNGEFVLVGKYMRLCGVHAVSACSVVHSEVQVRNARQEPCFDNACSRANGVGITISQQYESIDSHELHGSSPQHQFLRQPRRPLP